MNKAQSVSRLFVDMNSYFASCEQQMNPALRGRPVAVVPMLSDTTCCLAASYEAKAHGVKTGTMVGEARRLCPGIVFVQSGHDRYIKFHHAIVDAVESCVPVHQILSVDEMVCRLTGSQTAPDVAIALARKVKHTIQSKVGECLRSSVGLATNTLLAKMGSDMQKPDGLTVLTRDVLREKLETLTLRDIPGVGPRMEKRLMLHGVRTMEQLLRCDVHQMRALWGGIVGERFYHWLRGDDVDMPASRTTCIGHEHVLPPALRSKPQAHVILQKLTAKAAVRLRRGGYYAKRISVHAKYVTPYTAHERGDSNYWDAARKLPEIQDTLGFLKVLEEMWRLSPELKPFKVGVTLTDLVPAAEHQYSLFGDAKGERLAHALDEVNDRFGTSTLYFAGIHDAATAAPTRIAFGRIPGLDEF